MIYALCCKMPEACLWERMGVLWGPWHSQGIKVELAVFPRSPSVCLGLLQVLSCGLDARKAHSSCQKHLLQEAFRERHTMQVGSSF